MFELRQRNIPKFNELIKENNDNNNNTGTSTSKNFVKKDKKNLKIIFFSLLIFRIVNALTIKTYFNPDEYWQSVEIAHNIVFGYPFFFAAICLF